MRELIGLALRRAGFGFAEAGDVEEARRAINADPPDLVLLDWMLPGRSGYELARELRESPGTRDLPLIVVARAPVTPPAG